MSIDQAVGEENQVVDKMRGREEGKKRRKGGKEGKGKKGREVKEKRIGREKGRIMG